MLSTVVLSNENQTCRGWEAPTSTGGGGCHKENKEVQKAVNYLENHFNKKEKSLMKPKKPEQAPKL